ncbi:MAG: 16S rRNA (cytidine(1402)-2'-O)-methyltransferase, partial [Rhizobiales bacterium]|nr:16S rRNA (cytidine(1402)-2'-O)-methyltransferase [Hyphomicrobiales bacterium]
AAEDTRHTGQLLSHFDIRTPLISCHAFNERAREAELMEKLAHGDVALVTDAGTPGVSDPGALIVDAAHRSGFPVVSIPGPSALTAAISVSGLVDGPVAFLGFPPRKAKEREALLRKADEAGFSFVLFEAPNRVAGTLAAIAEIDPERQVAIIRELSKLHEETIRGAAGELAERFHDQPLRGEVVIVVQAGAPPPVDIEDADRMVADLIAGGMRTADAAKQVAAATGIPRSNLYQRALKVKPSRTGNPACGDA